MIDWKRVAQQRLVGIRNRDTARETMRANLDLYLREELLMALHARCIGNATIIATDVAQRVAERVAR